MTDITVYDLDPVAIRTELQRERDRGIRFDEAWETATEHPISDDGDVYAFMRKHFEAAYHTDESKRGRCMVPARDVSSAVRGRFGKIWCAHHASELETLTETVILERQKAVPRKGGNTALYTHRAA